MLLGGVLAAGRLALAAGITTARDLGDRGFVSLSARAIFAADSSAGPELLVAGPPITTPQGHCWFLGGATETDDASLRRAVRERSLRGADVIKVMVTGGNLLPGAPPHESQFSFAQLRVPRAPPASAGYPLPGTPTGLVGIADAVAAGFSGIEHCTFFTADSAEPNAVTIDNIAAADILVTNTAAQLNPRSGDRNPAVQRRPPGIVRGVELRAAGIQVALASDAGIDSLRPHDCLPTRGRRPASLRNAGSSVFGRCHVNGGRGLRSRARKGRLQPGYDADILAVAGDPTCEIGDLLRVRAVLRGGRLVTP